MELLDEPQRLEDLPEEFRINRFSFRFDVDRDVFVVTQENASKAVPWVATLFFSLLAGLFSIVGWSAYTTEGFQGTAIMMLVFALFCLFFLGLSIYKLRFQETRFEFQSTGLRIISRLRILEFSRTEFNVSKVQTTIFQDYMQRETGYRVDVALLFGPGAKSFGVKQLELFHLDGKSAAKTLLGGLDREEMKQVEQEGQRIAEVLKIYWGLPVK